MDSPSREIKFSKRLLIEVNFARLFKAKTCFKTNSNLNGIHTEIKLQTLVIIHIYLEVTSTSVSVNSGNFSINFKVHTTVIN